MVSTRHVPSPLYAHPLLCVCNVQFASHMRETRGVAGGMQWSIQKDYWMCALADKSANESVLMSIWFINKHKQTDMPRVRCATCKSWNSAHRLLHVSLEIAPRDSQSYNLSFVFNSLRSNVLVAPFGEIVSSVPKALFVLWRIAVIRVQVRLLKPGSLSWHGSWAQVGRRACNCFDSRGFERRVLNMRTPDFRSRPGASDGYARLWSWRIW